MESQDDEVQTLIYRKRLIAMFSQIEPGSDRVYNNAYKFHQEALHSLLTRWFPDHPEYKVTYTRGPIEKKVKTFGKKKITTKEGYVSLKVERAVVSTAPKVVSKKKGDRKTDRK
jgi:hypothetical protein